MNRPFLTIGLTMLCAMYALFYIGTAFTVAVAALFLSAAAVCAFFRHRAARPLLLLGSASLFAVFLYTYTVTCSVTPALALCGNGINITGTLRDYPMLANDRYLYEIADCNIAGHPTSLSVLLSDAALFKCKPGDTLSFRAIELLPYAQEGERTYFQQMANGIWLFTYTDNISVSACDAVPLRYFPCVLRHTMLQILQDRLPETQAAVVSGLLLGNKEHLPTEVALQFKTCGLSHLFAVSGFHLSFWTGVLVFTLGKNRNRRHICILACLFILFFMALTGFSVSVCRSGFMLLTVFAGNLFRRDADSLNSLGLAVFLLLTGNPFSAADAALLLSAGATASIILTSESADVYILQPLAERIRIPLLKKGFTSFAGLFLISTAVNIGLLPLTSYFYGFISLLTPFANMFCIFPAQLAMILGMTAQIFNRIPYFSDFLFALTKLITDILLRFTEFFSGFPFALQPLHTAAVTIWFAATVLLLALIGTYYDSNPAKKVIAFLASLCILLFCTNIFTATDNVTRLYIQNVGNGSCIALYDTHGNGAVIGCGGNELTVTRLQNELYYNGISTPRLLLAVRDTPTESAALQLMIQQLQPEQILHPSGITLPDTQTNTICGDAASVHLWQDCILTYSYTDSYCAAHLKIHETDIVFCFLPTSDFTSAQSEFTSGDLLICRQAVPPSLHENNFDRIVISGDKEKEKYNFPASMADKVLCTADEGSVLLKVTDHGITQ